MGEEEQEGSGRVGEEEEGSGVGRQLKLIDHQLLVLSRKTIVCLCDSPAGVFDSGYKITFLFTHHVT